MREAVRRGLGLRREHGIRGVASEDEVDAVLVEAGLVVHEDYPFAGDRIRGLLAGGVVYVRRRMGSRERAFVKAHELCHHLFHEAMPAAFYVRAPGQRYASRGGRFEREADAFAGALIAGVPGQSGDEDLPAWLEACHAGGVPAEQLWELASIMTRTWPV